MIKIISFKICPFVQRVTALLEAKKIPYDLEYIKLSDKPQWFLDISPNGQVPILITETGTALIESDAIVEYLEEAYPPLEAELTLEQKALNRAWSYQASKNYLAQCAAMRSANQDTLMERKDNLDKLFAKVEKVITDGPFFNGTSLSNIDVAWLPLLHRADIIRRYAGFDFLDQFPKVRAWQAAIMKTGLAEKSVADDFEVAFTEFYLSENTYLGTSKDCENFTDSQCASGNCC